METINQFVEISVTRKKFDTEIQEYKDLESQYRKKGIFCLDISFPNITLMFAIPQIIPYPIAFAAKFDYSNWDAEPPSIIFVNPFSGENIIGNEIRIQFLQKNTNNHLGQPSIMDLLQSRETGTPFICIPGVKEYHNHPAHSGDSWFLYRTKGEGKLITLIDQLYKHSIIPAVGYNVQMNFNVSGIGADLNKII